MNPSVLAVSEVTASQPPPAVAGISTTAANIEAMTESDHGAQPVTAGAIAASAAGQPYRPEIDGLRALAVLAVMINHFRKGLLPSGYLGVDVFFVISGYVITASLLGLTGGSSWSLLTSFYSRRMKRLVPALLVSVVAGSLIVTLFDPAPDKSLTVGGHALFGLANVELLRQATDYFAQSTEFNMFTHMWSLGVEEQFYLVFPLIVLASRRRGSRTGSAFNIAVVMGLVSAASLFLMLRMRTQNQARAYFFMPARFWEIGVGCVLFAWLAARGADDAPRLSPRSGSAAIAALVGLLAVLGAPLSLSTPATVAAVALTVVLLHQVAATPVGSAGAAMRTLASRPAVFVGKISYSLYLWHWIVLVTARWTIGVSLRTTPFLVFLSFVLAWLSYRFVESPLRHAPWFRRKTLTILAALCLLGAGLDAVHHIGERNGYVGDTKALAALPGCFQPEGHVWVFGDSHAEALSPAVQLATDGRCSERIRRGDDTGTSFLLDHNRWATDHGTTDSEIRLRSPDRLVNYVKAGNPGAIVAESYLVGFFGPQPSPYKSADWPVLAYYDETGQPMERVAALDRHVANIATFAQRIAPTKLLLTLPPPDFDWVGRGGPSDGCQKQWFHLGRGPTANGCDVYLRGARVPVAEAEARRADVVSRLRAVAAAAPNVVLYDPFPLLCPNGFCSTHSPSGELLFRDDDHIGTGAQRLIAAELRGVLNANGMLPPP